MLTLRRQHLTIGIGLVASLAAATMAAPAQASSHPSTTLVADWEMNEPAGSHVMVDSSGNGHDGTIPAGSAITTGNTDSTDAVFYRWPHHCPSCAPADPTRVISIPDAPDGSLDIPDANSTYTLTFRFRTTNGFGNYMQKGQSASKGGQIKVQGPNGNVQCLFKGANGTRVGTGWGASRPLDDGNWHTVSCIRTPTEVMEYVDNNPTPVITKGATGPIDNTIAMTVGGKLNCDQIKTTCDYYSGDIDYISITKS